jgi:DNA-binding transcriptional ArsR family regulator
MLELIAYFHALDDRKRLGIVRYLANHDQITVSDLGAKLRLSQPLISWHLRLLRKADIVRTRRAGRQVWCSLNREALLNYERRVDQILGLEQDERTEDDVSTTVARAG